MSRDVFISYRHEDQELADRVCATLERQNISCWIAPRDISPGQPWAASIVEGIRRCHTFVLLLSSNCTQSKQIARELELADAGVLRMIALRVENVQPPADLLYFLGNVQWLDAFDGHLEAALTRLTDTITQLDSYPAVKTAVHHRPLAPAVAPLMAAAAVMPPVAAARPFSLRGHSRFFAIVAAGLLSVGIGAGAYRSVQHSESHDAYRAAQHDAERHNLTAAIQEYTTAIQIDPSNYNAYCERAEIYQDLGRTSEARSDLKRAIAIHPWWPFALDLQREFSKQSRL